MSRVRLMMRGKRGGAAPPEPIIQTIQPAAPYDGTEGSGGAAPSVTRTRWPTAHITSVAAAINDYTASPEPEGMCTIAPLFKSLVTFTDYYDLYFSADARSGIAYVRVEMEGGQVDITELTEGTYINVNSGTSPIIGYRVRINAADLLAYSETPSVRVYATAVSNDPENEPSRTIGPFLLHARAPGVGPINEFDADIEIDPLAASVIPGQRYFDVNAAMLWVTQNGKMRPRFRFTREYDPGNPATRYAGFQASNLSTRRDFATTLAVFEPAPGVNAYWGDYSGTSGAPGFDGILVRNAGGGTIKMDLIGMAPGTATGQIGGVWRGHTNSFNVFYLEGVEVFDGAIPAEQGGTGSGMNALKWGFDRNGYWLTTQKIATASVGAQPLHFIAIDVNAHDLSQYGLGFGELLLNSSLRNCSGSAVEGMWGIVQGCAISRMGGYASGQRFHKSLATLIPPQDGSLYEFQKVGANGRGTGSGASNGLYLYKDGIQTYFLPLNDSQTSTTTMPLAALQDIEANTDWTYSDYNTETTLAAVYMSVPSNNPADAISRRTVPSGGIALTTIADIHANGVVYDNTGLFHNVVFEYNTVYEVFGAALVTLAQLTNSCVRNNVFQSVSELELGQPEQVSPITRETRGLLYYANTHMGDMNSFQLASNVTWTSGKGRNDHNYFDGYAKATSSVGAVLSKSAIRRNAPPSGSVDCLDLGSASENTLFEAPLARPPDARPKAPLMLADGAWVGAILPSGAWNRAAAA